MKVRIPPTSILLIALLVPMLNLIPTWQGYYYQSPPERVFMGFRYLPGDHYQYAAFMRQARDRGSLFMENPFTSERQKGVFVLPYFWLLGTLSRITGAEITTLWGVFRVLGGALYIIAFWYFTGAYFREGRPRLLATVIFSLAGGVDWIVTILRAAFLPALKPVEYPYDSFWNWSTFGTMQFPNWVWPALLLTAAAHVLLSRLLRKDLLNFLILPAIWFLHAYTGMVAYLAFGLLPVMPLLLAGARLEPLPWRRARENFRTALPGLLSFTVVISYLAWARTDEVFRLSGARALTWTDNFSVWWYPLSYGLLLPLAGFGICALAREKTLKSDLVLSWLSAAFILSVNPLFAGVKFQYLLFPPLAILAARGVFFLLEASEAARRTAASKPAIAVVALLLFLNAPVSLVKDMSAARIDHEIYMSSDEIEAMKWLQGEPDGLVLSSYRAGNRIPWLARKKVYIGHWFMTLGLNEKSQELAYFFSPQVPTPFKRELLRRSGARYVYVEPGQTPDLDHPGLPLTRVYSAGGYTIYQVELPRRDGAGFLNGGAGLAFAQLTRVEFNVADGACVIDNNRIQHSGSAPTLCQSEELKRRYLAV